MIALREAFEQLLAQLDRFEMPYLIGGSVASSSYGMPRLTNDIDILADFKGVDLEEFCRSIGLDFYVDVDVVKGAVQAGRPFNIIHTRES